MSVVMSLCVSVGGSAVVSSIIRAEKYKYYYYTYSISSETPETNGFYKFHQSHNSTSDIRLPASPDHDPVYSRADLELEVIRIYKALRNADIQF